MERYLIALDMDGTLLNKNKEIMPLTKKILMDLSKEGHLVVLASGRPYRSLKPYYEELELTSPIILYNGAFVFDPKDDSFPAHKLTLPKEVIKDTIDKTSKYITNMMSETNTDIYLNHEDDYLDVFFFYDGMKLHYGDLKETLNEDAMTFIARLKDDITKEEKERIKSYFPTKDGIDLRYWTASPYYELYHQHATKGACVKIIADHYNIPKERIICFGDALNDLEMLKEAKYGVAMSNGKESFKKKAPYISLDDNENEGIYLTLKAIFEGKLD